jgi:AraC family transcriptional regulator
MARTTHLIGTRQWIRSLERTTALVNSPARLLGRHNAVYMGTGREHDSGEVDGWLSIKTMLAGTAVWETRERRFTVSESSYLILNDRHPYRLRFDSAVPVTTFALFFARGLAEDAFRCRAHPSSRLLESPMESAAPVEFVERLETRASPLFGLIERFCTMLSTGLPPLEAEDWFLRLARQMVSEHRALARVAARLPGVRTSTREELYRRVVRGRDYLLSTAGGRARLSDAARAACLSPFHFHRAFSRAFGITPHQALTRHRLERAAALLGRGESVTQACLASGFESLGSFSSLFYRRYGISPRNFRLGKQRISKNGEVWIHSAA